MDRIAGHYPLHRLSREEDADSVLAGVGDRIRGLVSSGGYRVDQGLLDRLPNLAVIAVTGAGYDQIVLAAARARGIAICNAPGVTATCVADMVMGLYLAVARRIVANDRFVRDRRWLDERCRRTRRASGRPIGIWGLGAIGREVAKRASAFGMPIHYHSRRRRPELPFHYQPSLIELARAVEVLVCTVPSTPETARSVDGHVLAALGAEGILVNVARGQVVDQPALIQALRESRIAGAGLDVFIDEPIVADDLLTLENVVLSPHTAGSTFETWDEVVDTILGNFESWFRDGRLLTPIPD